MEKSGVSPLVIRIVIVAIAIVMAIAVAYWMLGLGGTLVFKGVTADVKARIYAPEQNIGVLNEEGLFNINVRNYGNLTRTIRVIINAEDYVVDNETITIEAEASENKTITQTLDSLGEWRIKVLDEDNKNVGSYSFLIVLNKGEANVRVNQWNDIQDSKKLSIISAVISGIGLIISALALRASRARRTKNPR
jgi:hypothetical protein